ncbi:tyrosine-type recombinase/integrase [Nocardiopsis alba]|uniref:tyrosine-type recombinase/integrase n=1 Tax=Nocardiopsis alba TaxID=53437 RepID=UPI0033C2C248
MSTGEVGPGVLAQIYEIGDSRDLPQELRGENSGILPRVKVRHHLSEPDTVIDRASDAEAIALLRACRLARDRFIILLLARAGLRRSEAAGLRREDLHLALDSTALGCRHQGAHVHVVRRANPNGAWAKSRHIRAVPADWLLVQAHDQWWMERQRRSLPIDSDFELVNIDRGRLGEPMRPGSLNDLLERLSRRAELGRPVTPHMLRHAFASNVLDAGGAIDEVQILLGHQSVTSSQIYVHPDFARQRVAIERVPSARDLATATRGE